MSLVRRRIAVLGGSSIAAPFLIFVGPSNDSTPALDVGGLAAIAQVGDLIEAEYFLLPGGPWTAYFTSAPLTAPQIAGDTIAVSGVAPIENGDYEFRARLKRGARNGAWSNVVTGTIAATAGEMFGFPFPITKAA
jgi:hypothetical protein